MKIKFINLQLFADPSDTFTYSSTLNTNTTQGAGLSNEMKTYYSDYLIDMAEPELVHDQFAQKHPIPRNGGKTIQFRKYASLAKATTPLTEGVTPQGKKLNVSVIEATVEQFGDYVALSDMLIMTAIDNNIVEATKLLGSQAGRTLDTITRDAMAAGTNILYGDGSFATRSALITGKATAPAKLTVKAIKRAAHDLKAQNAPKIDGSYVAIIHPDTEFDVMNDPEWIAASQYAGSQQIFLGEIGKIGGVRFVETSEAKIIVDSSTPIYYTFVLGANAYGTTEITGGGLQHIVKQLGSSGTADPLNQRATVGWKATKVSKVLVDEYMVRVETVSSFPSRTAN